MITPPKEYMIIGLNYSNLLTECSYLKPVDAKLTSTLLAYSMNEIIPHYQSQFLEPVPITRRMMNKAIISLNHLRDIHRGADLYDTLIKFEKTHKLGHHTYNSLAYYLTQIRILIKFLERGYNSTPTTVMEIVGT